MTTTEIVNKTFSCWKVNEIWNKIKNLHYIKNIIYKIYYKYNKISLKKDEGLLKNK